MKMKTIRKLRIALAVLPILAPSTVLADRRAYVRTYEYMTNPAGNLELELYTDFQSHDLATSRGEGWTQQVELEYGLTDRWDVSLYHVFTQKAGSSLAYDGFKLRTRYRLGERGLWPVDPLLYLEVVRTASFATPWKVEAKLILARDFGKLNVVTNVVYEQRVTRAEMHPEGAYAIGASWELMPVLKLGAEAWGSIEPDEGKLELKNYAGPVLSVMGRQIWLALGLGIGYGEHADALQVRSIMGIDL